MFMGIVKAIHLTPEGIICPIGAFLHKIPSGLTKNGCSLFYKHTSHREFETKFDVRHKTDNSEIKYKKGIFS